MGGRCVYSFTVFWAALTVCDLLSWHHYRKRWPLCLNTKPPCPWLSLAAKRLIWVPKECDSQMAECCFFKTLEWCSHSLIQWGRGGGGFYTMVSDGFPEGTEIQEDFHCRTRPGTGVQPGRDDQPSCWRVTPSTIGYCVKEAPLTQLGWQDALMRKRWLWKMPDQGSNPAFSTHQLQNFVQARGFLFTMGCFMDMTAMITIISALQSCSEDWIQYNVYSTWHLMDSWKY